MDQYLPPNDFQLKVEYALKHSKPIALHYIELYDFTTASEAFKDVCEELLKNGCITKYQYDEVIRG